MADRSVVVRLRAEVDGFRRGLNDAADAAQQATNRFDGMEKAGKNLAMVGGIIALGVGVAVKAYADFDEQMSKVQAATHASSAEMEQLRAAAIAAGADTSFSAKEAGQAIEELSKAGVSTADILNGGLDGALALAAAGSLAVADAAEIAATAMVQFKLSGQDIPHVADLLAAGAGKAQGSVEDIAMALKQGGLVAASFGLTIDETVGTLAAFASAGLLGSDAGTSLKTSLLMLANPSKESAAKMRELGINAYDAAGNFVGMAKLAGNLQNSLGGLTQEQRNAALATIFGSDAIRVANILYEQGEAGVNKWTGAVNDAGYAALTASIQQNNLKGDIERLTGSIDSVFIKSGSGMNDMLRGMAKGAEGLVDAIGKIPSPMLATSLSIVGVVGGLALLAGGVMMAIPKIAAARATWIAFSASNAALAGTLVKTAKVAGIALAALMALQIIASVVKSTEKARGGVEDFNQALLNMKPESFDAQVSGMMDGVNGIGDAFNRLANGQWYDSLNSGLGDLTGWGSPIKSVQTAVGNLDSSLSDLAQKGGLTRAGAAFGIMATEADKSAKAQGRSGMAAEDVLKLMPSYTSALKEKATALGVELQGNELLELAYGRIPPRLEAVAAANGKSAELQKMQKGASEEQAKALAEVGLASDGTIASLTKLLDAMFKTGLATLSATEAESRYQETLAGLDVEINKIIASQGGANVIIDAATGSFNLTAKSGRDAAGAFGEVAQKGIDSMTAMANNGATQAELQGKLRGTYDALVATAEKFGFSRDRADELARSALGIPKNVPIETAIQNHADTMAKLAGIKQAAAELSGLRVPIYVEVSQSGSLSPQEYSDALSKSKSGAPVFHADGGRIAAYHADGGALRPAYHAAGRMVAMIPNGTDTVPIMGTPGEYMIKRSSARSIGYENLAYANATGRLPNGGSSGPTVNNNFGNVTVANLDELVRKQDTARRDALAMIGG